jgi:predicted HTH domain antitoxin
LRTSSLVVTFPAFCYGCDRSIISKNRGLQLKETVSILAIATNTAIGFPSNPAIALLTCYNCCIRVRDRSELKIMSTTELKVDLPLGLSESEAKLLLAIKLYEVEKASLGQAAKLAGFSKRTFMEILGQYRVPIFAYSPEELRQELGL